MTAQGDWLEHARRHLERAEWHRARGGDDLVYARNELAGAISDLWVAAEEIEEEVESPRIVHLSPPFGENTLVPCCGAWLHRGGEWKHRTRTTTDPSKVTCPDYDAEHPFSEPAEVHGDLIAPGRLGAPEADNAAPVRPDGCVSGADQTEGTVT